MTRSSASQGQEKVTSLSELEKAATSDIGPLRLPLEVDQDAGSVWMADGDRFYAETVPEYLAATLNALPLLLDLWDAAWELNMTMPDTGDTDPLSALDDALQALEHLREGKTGSPTDE